jgi:hypothetical protein
MYLRIIFAFIIVKLLQIIQQAHFCGQAVWCAYLAETADGIITEQYSKTLLI